MHPFAGQRWVGQCIGHDLKSKLYKGNYSCVQMLRIIEGKLDRFLSAGVVDEIETLVMSKYCEMNVSAMTPYKLFEPSYTKFDNDHRLQFIFSDGSELTADLAKGKSKENIELSEIYDIMKTHVKKYMLKLKSTKGVQILPIPDLCDIRISVDKKGIPCRIVQLFIDGKYYNMDIPLTPSA